MADVQLEHGYVRVANRIVEAILDADFTGAQVRILLAVMRLTYGWRRRTVTITMPDLAKFAKLSPTGGFRRAFHDLIEHGVIIELKEGRSTSYAIQKDFTLWGLYGGNDRKLSAIWDRRPKSDDPLLRHHQATGQLTLEGHSASPSADDDQMTLQGHDAENESDPTGSPAEVTPTPQGHAALPYRVRGTGPNSLIGETFERRKDRKDSSTYTPLKTPLAVASVVSASDRDEMLAVADDEEREQPLAFEAPRTADESDDEQRETTGDTTRAVAPMQTASRARADDEASELVRQYAIGMSTAANAGIEYRWGAQPNLLNYASGLDVAGELLAEGVPLELARSTIASVCHASKNPRPPNSLRYFRSPIIDAKREAEQRAFQAGESAARRGGAPAPVAAVVDPDRERKEHEARVAYDSAAREAALAWGKAPENKAAYTEIVAKVQASYANVAASGWRERGIATDVIRACAERAGFPSFDAWLAARGATAA